MLINASRFKATWSWLLERGYAWLTAIIIVFAIIISFLLCRTEPVIRVTGLVLQVCGLFSVILGIRETRALFGHPSLTSKAKAYFRRVPLLRHDLVISAGGLIGSAALGKGRIYGTSGAPGPNPTIEARLEALEKNITSIHERISQTQKEMDEEFQKTANALKREEQARQEENKKISEKLEVTATGGFYVSASGAVLLLVGIILSTASLEIASLFK